MQGNTWRDGSLELLGVGVRGLTFSFGSNYTPRWVSCWLNVDISKPFLTRVLFTCVTSFLLASLGNKIATR